jgi:glutaredoxin
MEFVDPLDSGFTIYSKSGCINCSKVKKLLQENRVSCKIIDCDDYILEDKPRFLLFINKLAGVNVKTFPIVFNNGTFLGSYTETKDYIDKINCFDANISI